MLGNYNVGKKGLKLEGGSVNERSLQPPLANSPDMFKKKKSQAQFQSRNDEGGEKSKPKKLSKMMS